MDRLIRLEPSSLVVVRIEPGQKCSGELTLRNVMYTMPVAFKLQVMNKARYAVRPQSGIIPPLAGLTVEITYHLPQGSILPDSCPHGEDSFFLHSVVAPGAAAAKDLSSTLDAVPSDWFTVKKKQVFIDSGIKIMFVGSPVLARLVEGGSMDEIRAVLERSDPKWKAVDAVNHDGRSLLHLAIARRRADIVQLLLEFEPTLETSGQSTATPLEAAVSSGESLIVELLLSRRACTERSEALSLGPIHLATIGGHIEILRLLLERGANVDALTQVGSTALHLAVAERRRDCVWLLLAAGARTDAHNTKDGDTPLHIAAALGDENMVKLLLHKGANKDIRNRSGKTPYDLAAENGHTAMFDALCLGDRLCTAARNGEVRTIHRLLETGAVVNGRDQHGWTALHRASFKGHIDAAKALLDKGIKIDARDGDGYTALHCAVESGHGDMVELLLKKGADVAARTNKGVSAMQMAQSLEYVGIMRILVHNGASRQGFGLTTKTAPASIGNRYMAIQEAKSNGGPKMKHRRRNLLAGVLIGPCQSLYHSMKKYIYIYIYIHTWDNNHHSVDAGVEPAIFRYAGGVANHLANSLSTSMTILLL